jgi:beta-lactamase superfamily II metal-dependent hydrolase
LNPTVHIFKAGKGDSALFRYKDKNILIDGGHLIKPNFWQIVKNVPKIDYMVLTHGDSDHFVGLVSYLYFKDKGEDLPDVDKIMMISNVKYGRNFHHVKAIENFTNVFKGETHLHDVKAKKCFDVVDGLKIDIVLPTEDFLTFAQNIISDNLKGDKISTVNGVKRDITDINRFGICLLITCEEKFYLFTADCDARDIVTSLKLNYPEVEKVFYVDAPHHESDHNYSEALFEYLKEITHLVVSTNGKSHGHPHKGFLKNIQQYKDQEKIKNVHFNYNEDTKKKSSDENYNDGDYITIPKEL